MILSDFVLMDLRGLGLSSSSADKVLEEEIKPQIDSLFMRGVPWDIDIRQVDPEYLNTILVTGRQATLDWAAENDPKSPFLINYKSTTPE